MRRKQNLTRTSDAMTTDKMISGLLDPAAYPHPCVSVTMVETHISWVFLTGLRAYKIKKPVDLGFVDFRSPKQRKFFCEEELRLNRRLAPGLYLCVVPVTQCGDRIQIDGSGDPIGYAVCMKQFDPDHVLSRLSLSELTPERADRLADELAAFHEGAAVSSNPAVGSPEEIGRACEDNFRCLSLTDAPDTSVVHQSELLCRDALQRLSPVFLQRIEERRVRECHGDLHLGNMFLAGDRITVFDGIEFNDSFRWIDTASDIAFLLMDLKDHNEPGKGNRILNRWLERTGDYGSLAVLPFYCSYRAAVRAKVDAIRQHQPEVAADEQRRLAGEGQRYLELAHEYLTPSRGSLSITMGPSGSGKTTVTQRMIDTEGVIRVRSDVERKRMFGLEMEMPCPDELKPTMYSAEAGQAVYKRLSAVAESLLQAGCDVVVDAAFLKRAERKRFARLAETQRVPFRILRCHAPAEILRQRITQRLSEGRDASDADVAVLTQQLEHIEPPDAEEEARMQFAT